MKKQKGAVLRFPQHGQIAGARPAELPWEAAMEVVIADPRAGMQDDPDEFLAQFGVVLWFERQASQARLAKTA